MNLAQNTFEGGLMMDLHPLSTPNTVATNCLNGTYLTYNGNEYVLLNDMGNGKVETAQLPSGYIPLGTTSYGGIIYIVSYNPLKDLCQIGCFPSPERNFSYEELSEDFTISTISDGNFKQDDEINNYLTKIKLTNVSLNPGDKFLITLKYTQGDNETIDYRISLTGNDCRVSDYMNNSKESGKNPKYLRLRVATNDSSGRLVYLDSSVKWYNLGSTSNPEYYFIPETSDQAKSTKSSSMYSIFNSKISGELWLVASLETITSFSYTYSIEIEKSETKEEETEETFDIENPGLEGSGTKSDPFIINDSDDLDKFSDLVSEGYNTINGKINYITTSVIQVNKHIGTEEYPFSGTFNGNGKQLKLFNQTASSYESIFEYAENAEIYNLDIQGLVISKDYGQIGVLVGHGKSVNIHNISINNLTIVDSKSTSSGKDGIFIITNEGDSIINNCFSNINCVIDKKHCEYVGTNNGTIEITNCFSNSTCTVNGKLDNIYSPGTITVTNCYHTYNSNDKGVIISKTDVKSGTLLSLLGDLWKQTNNYPIPIVYTSTSISESETSENLEGNYKLNIDAYWSSDYWNEEQKGIDPKYIIFNSEDFSLEGLTGEIDLSVYDDSQNTVLFTEDKTGNISERYTDIEIDLQNKVNHKEINLGIIPSKYLTEDLDSNGNNKNDKERRFSLTPAMEYGKLPTFQIENTINFALIGTGKTIINEWRYFKQDENIILTYGLEDYPQTGYETKLIVLEFVNIDSFMLDGYDLRSGNYDNIIYNTGKTSYSGSFTTEVEFAENFLENSLYLVRIIKKYGKKESEDYTTSIIGYRLLYTNGIFNDYYISDTEDFQELNIPESILTSGLIMNNSNISIKEENLMYKDNSSEVYDINKIINESEAQTYNKIVCSKTMTVSGIKPTVNITSEYDLFSKFSTTDAGNSISQYKNSDGEYNDGTVTISSDISCSFGNYNKGTLTYKYSLVPLLKYTEDSYNYSLSFNSDTNHFYFDGFTTFGDDGHLGSGTIDYDDGSDTYYSSEESANNDTTNTNPYFGDNTSESNYYILNDEDLELLYYRASGNQCYPASKYQVQLTPYTSGTGNIIPMFFAETTKEAKNSMTYTHTGKPANFYYSTKSGTVNRFHINRASGNGGKNKEYGNPGVLIYSDLVNAYIKHDISGRTAFYKSEPTFDSNNNIKTDERLCLPSVSFLMKSVSNSGDELHLFSNNWAVLANRYPIAQNMFTATEMSFADVLAMFLMQTYKYDSNNVEREVYYPTEIEDCDDSSTATCILEVDSKTIIDDFNIGNYDRNDIKKKLSNINTSNLIFSSELDDSLRLEITDYVQYSITTDNLGKSDLTLLQDGSEINAVIVKSCYNGENYVLSKDSAISEDGLYMIDLNNRVYSKLTESSDKYKDYYRILNSFSYNSSDGDFEFTKYISEGGNSYLEPEHLEILTLDVDKNLIIDLDKYKKLIDLTWTLNTTRNYSCTHISGISTKFTLSKLLNVLS